MARKPRGFEAGAYYHIGSRGNNGEAIVRDDIDRIEFLRWYARIANDERWRVLAWALMDNHYHFIVRCDGSGLSRGMQRLNCGFARRINRRYGRDGHLFRQRFHGGPIEDNDHLKAACRYVVLNPVSAGLCKHPAEWHWSSYRATVDLELPPSFLDVGALLALFHTKPEAARRAYTAFVAAGHGSVSDTVTGV